eukprot:TRINITY_DN55177_c0_g1_i1.p2 TRINITY_DN55177_c0_g1~~TRINITY_DN55177_c0_g1_i1.p2  ORF type:complete len:366 (+),score=97.08 TRINITY_DN55177_c0_g1_i1:83-1099(+)
MAGVVKAAALVGSGAGLCTVMSQAGQPNPLSVAAVLGAAVVCSARVGLQGRRNGHASALEKSGAVAPVEAVLHTKDSGPVGQDGLRVGDTFRGIRISLPSSRCPRYNGAAAAAPPPARRGSSTPAAAAAAAPASAATGPAALARRTVPEAVRAQRDRRGYRWPDSFEGVTISAPPDWGPAYLARPRPGSPAPPRSQTLPQQQGRAPAAPRPQQGGTPAPRAAPVPKGDKDSFEGVRVQGPSALCPSYAPQRAAQGARGPASPPRGAAAPAAPPPAQGQLAVGSAVRPSAEGLQLPHICELLPDGAVGEVVGFSRRGDPQVRVAGGRIVALSSSNLSPA